jgi:hypothetical protein
MVKPKAEQEVPDLGEFKPLPEKTLEKLIEKGRQQAEDLDKAIRSQFELSDTDGALRLR